MNIIQSKKSLYSALRINSLFHIEETTKEKRLYLFMAPLDNDGSINYRSIELYTGRCRLPNVRKARTARTRAYLNNKQLFLLAIQREVLAQQKQSRGSGKRIVVNVPDWCKGLTETLPYITVRNH